MAGPSCETLGFSVLSMNYNVLGWLIWFILVLQMKQLVSGSKTLYFLSNNWFCDAKVCIALIIIGSVMQKLLFPC